MNDFIHTTLKIIYHFYNKIRLISSNYFWNIKEIINYIQPERLENPFQGVLNFYQ